MPTARKAARWWVPLALGAGRAADVFVQSVHMIRDEALAAGLTAREQEQLTLELYGQSAAYGAGGATFEAGLFPWEERAFDDERWPRGGRLLVGAAGAGREALALLRRGHAVDAFEPCPALAAQGAALDEPGLRFFEGSYGDLIARKLGAIRGPYDAVVLGWGSLSHLLDPAQRAALLREARELAPRGPVLASFLVEWPRTTRERRLRRALRWALKAGPNPPYFSAEAGFFHLFTRAEIEALAAQAGYRLGAYAESPYPHALLLPG